MQVAGLQATSKGASPAAHHTNHCGRIARSHARLAQHLAAPASSTRQVSAKSIRQSWRDALKEVGRANGAVISESLLE